MALGYNFKSFRRVKILGIDIGGTGIKSAPIDIKTGKLLHPKVRIKTPHPATPDAILGVIEEIVVYFNWKGPIGCGFPGVVEKNKILTAPNLDSSCLNIDLAKIIKKKTACPVQVINDADAAGIAEMSFGVGKGKKGVVILITIGTGLGSAIFTNGILVPNTEIGHMIIGKKGKEAEHVTSDSARKKQELSWEKWAQKLNAYLNYLHKLFWPEMIILGGGTTAHKNRFMDHLEVPCKVKIAKMGNDAGIVGAAMAFHVFTENK